MREISSVVEIIDNSRIAVKCATELQLIALKCMKMSGYIKNIERTNQPSTPNPQIYIAMNSCFESAVFYYFNF